MTNTRKVRTERKGPALHVTLVAPPLNILDIEMLRDLADAFETTAREPEPPHVVVISGEGERAFSAGASVADHVPERVAEMLASFHRAIRALREMPSVALAAVRG